MKTYATIGEAFKLKSGVQLSAKNMKEGKYPVFGGNGINGYHNEFLFENSKIVIGRVGAYCGNVQKTLPYSWITDNALFIDRKLLDYNDDYLVYLLRNLNLNSYASKSGQPLISFGRIKDIKIPLPPLPTQKKIAAILDEADRLRRLNRAVIEQYDQLTEALFLEMFGDPVLNPKKWQEKTIFEVCERISGGGTPSKSNKKYFKGNIPWVTPKDMKSIIINNSIDKITPDAILNSSAKLIPARSVLMVIRSGILKKKLPVAINSIEVTLNQDMKAFIPQKTILSVDYLLFFFLAVQKFLLGKVRGVTADNIEFKQIKELIIPLPPISLQNQFAERVQAIEAQKAQAEAALAASEDLFEGLLQKAFKGELV